VLGLNVYQVGSETIRRGAFQAITRQVSAETYLAENLGMVQFAMMAVNELPGSARVLLLFEPRGFACLPACDPDELLDRWKVDIEAARHDPVEAVAGWKGAGYTHVLFNRHGAAFFREDPRYRIEDWLTLNAVITSLDPVVDLDGVYTLLEIP
jgi:hypothetical protein